MPGCCGNAGNAILEAKRAIGELPRETVKIADLPNEVRLQFTGVWTGPVGFTVNGRTYYGAQDGLHQFINAPREDVEKLVASGKWRVLASPVETSLKPEPAAPPPQNGVMEPILLSQSRNAGVPNSFIGIKK